MLNQPSTKVRISKGGKFAGYFTQDVADQIRQIAKRNHVASATIIDVAPDKTFVVGEGEFYSAMHPDGRNASFQVVSENTLGASGVSHAINSEFQLPAGTTLVVVGYLGGYYMSVYRITAGLPEKV